MFRGRVPSDPRPITGRRPAVCPARPIVEFFPTRHVLPIHNVRMEIRAGNVTAMYLFDVAEQIDLARLRGTVGGGSTPRFASKSMTPAYLQYQVPPLVVEGDAAGVAIDGFTSRLKFFDYGVVSLALSRRFNGTWNELVATAHEYIENAAVEERAERAVRDVVARCGEAMPRLRQSWLSEDYLVIAVTEVEGHPNAEALLAEHGRFIAQGLRGETQALSSQEEEEVLRNRLSYLATDLVIPTWNAAFVYDTEAGAFAALELFEFANSQLLEFRYYDGLLDAELARIYPSLPRTTWRKSLFGGRAVQAANQLHSLFIEVNEITDHTENALKIVGDIYAARVFSMVAVRLGLARWKQNVEEKLKTLDDIYKSVVDQVSISRGQFLELLVVLILILELILFFLGVMK